MRLSLFIILIFTISCASKNQQVIYPKNINSLYYESLENQSTLAQSSPLLKNFHLCVEKEPAKFYELAHKLLDKEQHKFSYWNIIGNCYLQNKENSQAMFFYKIALSKARTNKQKAIASNNFGAYYLAIGREQIAISQFEAALKRYPRFKTPHLNLANIYVRNNLFRRAQDHLRKLNSFSPEVVALNAVMDIKKNNLKGAQDKLDKLNSDYKKIPESRMAFDLLAAVSEK